MIDGRSQRRALTAAERAIDLLASGDGDGAFRAARTAADLDQIGVFGSLPDLVARAAADLAASDAVNGETTAAMIEALGPGPLSSAIEVKLA